MVEPMVEPKKLACDCLLSALLRFASSTRFSEPEDRFRCSGFFVVCESFKSRRLNVSCEAKPCFYRPPREVRNLRTLLSYFRRVAF